MTFDSDARTGRGWVTAPPPLMFGRSVNPLPTGEGRISPSVTTGTLKVFHLSASLFDVLTTSFHDKRILNFHDFTDLISSDQKFISFLFDLRGVFVKTFLMLKTFVKIWISLFVKICGEELN